MNKKLMDNIQYYYDLPYYYKDMCYSKLRYYLQPYINTSYNASKITDNVYISDFPSACNINRLKDDGITHILCAILSLDPIYPNDFTYKNVHVRDVSHENLTQYFDECVDFIDSAVKSGGKVLVHCSYGISRSASIVIAYLMKKHAMTYDEAYDYVKSHRDIIEPNDGFKEQLRKY
jgi:protein-tyrosine phosphatase